MTRRMADKHFRIDQWDHRYDKHVAPINLLVDEFRGAGLWLPYVAPMYGGVNARLLSILRDPGPKTQDTIGSGFLCMENDDATAENICKLFGDADIDPREIVPWNAYPWYINRKPNAAELEVGVEPLKRLIELIPGLKVIMLHGGDAHSGWKRLERRYPNLTSERGWHVIETYHPSRQAFWHKDPEVRSDRGKHLLDSFIEAASYLKR